MGGWEGTGLLNATNYLGPHIYGVNRGVLHLARVLPRVCSKKTSVVALKSLVKHGSGKICVLSPNASHRLEY